MSKWLLVGLIAIAFLVIAGVIIWVQEESILTNTYENNVLGIRIKYPVDWTPKLDDCILENSTDIVECFWVGVSFLPPESNHHAFRIQVQDFSDESRLSDDLKFQTLDEFAQFEIQGIKKVYQNYNIIDLTETKLAGIPAQKIVWTEKTFGKDTWKHVKIFSIKNNKGYFIYYSARIEDYPNFSDIFQKMADSFEII